MEIQCCDGLSGQSQCLELRCETASQLLTQVCELFGRAEEDAALEVDGEVVWVGCWDAADDVAVSSLSLSGEVVLRRSLERVLSLARDWTKLGTWGDSKLPSWAWEEGSVVMAAVRTWGPSLRHASVAWQNDREVVLAAVQECGIALQYAGESVRSDREVAIAAVRQFGASLKYAGDFRNDREVVLEATQRWGGSFKHASDSLRGDRSFVLEAVEVSGRALEHAGNFRNDREVVLAAVRQSGDALEYAGDFCNDREVVLAAVRESSDSFKYASDNLRGDRSFVLEALRQSGVALEHAGDFIKDSEVARAAARRSSSWRDPWMVVAFRQSVEWSHAVVVCAFALLCYGLTLYWETDVLVRRSETPVVETVET